MDIIRAIETLYAGYRMRSRLEARWAVFFDALAIPWQYELEGFHVGEQCYLPDFWLSGLRLWAEVKPDQEAVKTNEALYKAFSIGLKQDLLFLTGTPDMIDYKIMYSNGQLGIYRFTRLRKHKVVEAAVFAARSARFGKDGRG